MFLSSNPKVRCQIALKLLIRMNDMKSLMFNCFLTYKAADDGVTGALNELSEALAGTGGRGKREMPRWLGCPSLMWKEMSLKELAQTGQGQPDGVHRQRAAFLPA